MTPTPKKVPTWNRHSAAPRKPSIAPAKPKEEPEPKPVIPLFPPTRLPMDDDAFVQQPTQGVLTAGNKQHWQCIGATAIAASEYGFGFAVADHGLEGWQREELDRVGARIVEHQKPRLNLSLAMPGVVVDIRAWWKPWICLASPFNRTLWVDADAVLVDIPWDMFDPGRGMEISTEKLFKPDWAYLHTPLVATFFGTEVGYEDLYAINTGVLAFDKDDPWLWEWAAWCGRVMVDEALLSLCKTRDQSAALLSLIARRREGKNLPRLMPDEWNVPADHLTAPEMKRREYVPADPHRFLQVARERHPEAGVVHWLGCGKPWELIDEKAEPMSFTRDFVTENTDNWRVWLNEFVGTSHAALEIGSFEGRSTIWFAKNILTHPDARLTCIDPFTWLDAKDRFWANVRAAGVTDKLYVHETDSRMIQLQPDYLSWAYIDGNHDTEFVMWDAVTAWRALKHGGVLIFDDYMYRNEGSGIPTAQVAIDEFMRMMEGQYEQLSKPGSYQMCLRKK